ncbi:hypothetical protein ACVWXL_005459 [Bradyrhizobium sp. GM22.5]
MPIHGLVRSPQRSKTIDAVRSRQLRRPYTLFVPAARQRATVGSPPGLTSAPALSACLADEARLEIRRALPRQATGRRHRRRRGPGRRCWLGVVQTEDDETTNAGRAHLAQRDLHRAPARQVAVFVAGRFAHPTIKAARRHAGKLSISRRFRALSHNEACSSTSRMAARFLKQNASLGRGCTVSPSGGPAAQRPLSSLPLGLPSPPPLPQPLLPWWCSW